MFHVIHTLYIYDDTHTRNLSRDERSKRERERERKEKLDEHEEPYESLKNKIHARMERCQFVM